jgi:type IV pilus assembly protein PilB
MNNQQVLDLFTEAGYLGKDQVADLSHEIENSGKDLVSALTDFGLMSEDQCYQIIAGQVGADYYDLSDWDPPKEVTSAIPPGLARLHGALPVAVEGDSITVALTDPLNPQLVDDLRFALSKEILVAVAPIPQVDKKLDELYGEASGSMDDVLESLASDVEFADEGEVDQTQLQEQANQTPIIRFVDLVLQEAIQARASDIHFEPFEADFKIRYRVDGALYEMSPPPRSLASSVISRIKVMSGLNIAERRLPQDGRIQRHIAGRQVDLRVSTLPTQHGESVVLRVLDRSVVNLDLESLGMPDDIYDYIVDTVKKPNGIFIVTGPTGSGKTTTLYSALRKINTIDSKLLTAEDPVEYDIEGIIQLPVNEGIGLNFARALRAFLRQDPDRIMVGEMRDLETAQISIQASLTGHLVVSTLHTNDSAGAITRLIDMGAEPFLLSATLEGVLAQRLIRRICPDCRTAYEPSENVLSQLGLSIYDIGDKQFYYGEGCSTCNETGYKGRKGIFELLDIGEAMRELINERAPTVVIKQKAIELGMRPLRDDGLEAIYDGETTIEEVLKYT